MLNTNFNSSIGVKPFHVIYAAFIVESPVKQNDDEAVDTHDLPDEHRICWSENNSWVLKQPNKAKQNTI